MQEDYTIRIRFADGYAFDAEFEGTELAPLRVDEPPPLGSGEGPNPMRMLATAIAHCLSSSFLFCMRKARIDVQDLGATAVVHVGRNEKGRLRITGVDVELDPQFSEDAARAARCLDIFEDFCTVTASVREGIPVRTVVRGQPQVTPVAWRNGADRDSLALAGAG
jgi:organic hydroperoxide reductase OsmC/OhrA